MEALKFAERQKISRFEVDLSNATLIEVLESYETHKRKKSPKFTLSAVITNIKGFQEFCDEVIYPKDVTDIFYDDYINYLFCNKKLQYNSINNYCGSIRSALTWGCKHKCPVSSTYDEFTVPHHEPMRVSLTPDEISHIAHFDISTIATRPDHRKTLERVRDTFIIQVNLFQRFSDIIRISRANFNNGVYTCIQQKTGNKAYVDIKKYSMTPALVFKLLRKYNYECPYKYSLGHFNKHLHYLLSHIGGSFDEELSFEERQNGEVVTITKKRWQIISSHCARRSSITYAVQNSKTESEVRRCSGHVNHNDAFQRYIVFND